VPADQPTMIGLCLVINLVFVGLQKFIDGTVNIIILNIFFCENLRKISLMLKIGKKT